MKETEEERKEEKEGESEVGRKKSLLFLPKDRKEERSLEETYQGAPALTPQQGTSRWPSSFIAGVKPYVSLPSTQWQKETQAQQCLPTPLQKVTQQHCSPGKHIPTRQKTPEGTEWVSWQCPKNKQTRIVLQRLRKPYFIENKTHKSSRNLYQNLNWTTLCYNRRFK